MQTHIVADIGRKTDATFTGGDARPNIRGRWPVGDDVMGLIHDDRNNYSKWII
jgi:hypothetical protein